MSFLSIIVEILYLYLSLDYQSMQRPIKYFKTVFLLAISSIQLSAQTFENLDISSAEGLEILTWNIEWFPKNGQVTVNYVSQIIDALEKELSSGSLNPKLFATKSKEYSNLGSIIKTAREYINFESEKKDLVNLVQDKNNDREIIDLAQKDLDELTKKKRKV